MDNSGNEPIKIGSLEDEAKKRKERLASLKKSLENKNESKNCEDSVERTLPKYVKPQEFASKILLELSIVEVLYLF